MVIVRNIMTYGADIAIFYREFIWLTGRNFAGNTGKGIQIQTVKLFTIRVYAVTFSRLDGYGCSPRILPGRNVKQRGSKPPGIPGGIGFVYSEHGPVHNCIPGNVSIESIIPLFQINRVDLRSTFLGIAYGSSSVMKRFVDGDILSV